MDSNWKINISFWDCSSLRSSYLLLYFFPLYLVPWNMVFSLFFFRGWLFHHTLLLLTSLFLLRFWAIFVFEGFRYYLFDLRWQTQHISFLHILISSAQRPCVLRVELVWGSFACMWGFQLAYQSNDGPFTDNSINVRTFSMSFWTLRLLNIYFVLRVLGGFRSLYSLSFKVFRFSCSCSCPIILSTRGKASEVS